jgi:hypothetical protein
MHFMPDSTPLGCPKRGSHLHTLRRGSPNGAWAKRQPTAAPGRWKPVDHLVVLAYDQYVMERMALPHGRDSDFVLVNLFAEPLGAPMTADSINELFGRLSKRADLSRYVTPRMLRRAAGSNLADAGGGQDEIAALLDHARLRAGAVPDTGSGPSPGRGGRGAVAPRVHWWCPMSRLLTPVVTAPAPGTDASDAEVTAFLWSMISEDFLTEAGWNAERRVMTPTGHPTMGGRRCPVPNCESPVRGKKLCSTCYSRYRTSGMPLEDFVQAPRVSRHLHLGTENCRVSGCERPWINSGNEPVCRAHRWQMIKHGGTLEEFLADPSVKGLPGLGDCSVLACNRQAFNESGTRLCHPHGKRLPALRREPGFDEEEWLRTAPSGSYGIEISFRGLPLPASTA